MSNVGDLVFARVKGYRAWPARIQELIGKDRFSVFFYGTYQHGVVKQKDIWLYSFKEMWAKTGKNKTFNRALKEIEESPDISENPPPLPAAKRSPLKSDKRKKRKPSNTTDNHRKLYVQVKGTDEMIEIDLDRNRPNFFSSKIEADKWEEKNLKEVLRFKKLVEEGKYVPEEVITRLQNKKSKTDDEVKLIEKWAVLQNDRKEKVEWLKTEANLAQADLDLRACLSLHYPKLDKCLQILRSIQNLPVTPLMLKKQPQVVQSLQKICSYVGPNDPSVDKEKILNVRNLANAVMIKVQGCFGISENVNFMSHFHDELKKFREKIENLPSDKVTYMTSE